MINVSGLCHLYWVITVNVFLQCESKTVWLTLHAEKEMGRKYSLVPVVKMHSAKARQMWWGCQSIQGRNVMAASADQLGMKIKLFVIVAPHPRQLATINIYSIVEQQEDYPNISSNGSPPV